MESQVVPATPLTTLGFLLLVYGGVLLFTKPPRRMILASLLGGLLIAVVNAAADLVAYYAHWWHYDPHSGLVFHLPLLLYGPSIFIYGGIGYFLIWRFWRGRLRWLALLLLIGLPFFRVLLDALGAVNQTSYAIWESPLAVVIDLVQYLLAFYLGFLLFWRLAPPVPEPAETSEAPAAPRPEKADEPARP